jgi:integrase
MAIQPTKRKTEQRALSPPSAPPAIVNPESQPAGDFSTAFRVAQSVDAALATIKRTGLAPCSIEVLPDGTIRLQLTGPPQSKSDVAAAMARRSVSVGDVIRLYRESEAFGRMAASTQYEWGRWLLRIEQAFGDMSIEIFRFGETVRPMIRRWRNGFASTPRAADYGVQVLSRLLAYTVDPLGELNSNPCTGIKHLYRANRADKLWSDSDLATLREAASPDVGFAVDLAVTTGLRLDDLLRLTWSDVGKNAIVVATGKSRRRRDAIIPRYAALDSVIDRIPQAGATVLTNSRRISWTRSGFGSSFNKTKRRAGLGQRDLHFHDLRGNAATRFYMAGFSERVIAEILAWDERHVTRIIQRYVGRSAATRSMLRRLDELR